VGVGAEAGVEAAFGDVLFAAETDSIAFALELYASNRIARRFAGTMMDGIAEGSIRPVDALVAAQALMALQNAAFDMRKWAGTMPRERAVAMYASTLFFGLFDDRALRDA
jgi:hypothetical protein